jgi:hypothetical protein
MYARMTQNEILLIMSFRQLEPEHQAAFSRAIDRMIMGMKTEQATSTTPLPPASRGAPCARGRWALSRDTLQADRAVRAAYWPIVGHPSGPAR